MFLDVSWSGGEAVTISMLSVEVFVGVDVVIVGGSGVDVLDLSLVL